METKKYLSLVVALIAIGIIIYIWDTNKEVLPVITDNVPNTEISTQTSPASVAQPAVNKSADAVISSPVIKDGIYIVSYTNSGFQPQSLEISRGKSVRFVNDSTKALRVGDTTNTSDSQTFSQPKTVGKGGTYEYTFNEAGDYDYANQNNTADQGTIIVK